VLTRVVPASFPAPKAGGLVDKGRLTQAGDARISTPPVSCWVVWIVQNGRSCARRLLWRPVSIFGAQSGKCTSLSTEGTAGEVECPLPDGFLVEVKKIAPGLADVWAPELLNLNKVSFNHLFCKASASKLRRDRSLGRWPSCERVRGDPVL